MSDVLCFCYFFFFKQKTAYEMRISDWSSDVCSSDLLHRPHYGVDPDQGIQGADPLRRVQRIRDRARPRPATARVRRRAAAQLDQPVEAHDRRPRPAPWPYPGGPGLAPQGRSEEHTSELQSLMRISYAVFCLKNTNTKIK